MKKKCLYIIMAFALSFQIFVPYSLEVQASTAEVNNEKNQQPKVCNEPSEMMTNYFNFQSEAASILLWSDLNALRFSESLWTWWMFTNRILPLKSTAMDLLTSNILENIRSFVSNVTTSVVLLAMAWASVIQSNMDGFAILFKDRPIVRDYKTMLDIETVLFDIAYFRSKQISLTSPFESDMIDKLNTLVEKYQWVWLLDASKAKFEEGSTTMAAILYDLVAMNSSMRYFISHAGTRWKSKLNRFVWCASKKCDRENAILKFSPTAVEELSEAYEEVRAFSRCNSYRNFFSNTVEKAVDSHREWVEKSIKEMNDAMDRLKTALLWEWRRNFKNDPCDISDYELAQLEAYRWGNRKCGSWITLSTAIAKGLRYSKTRKVQRDQDNNTTNIMKQTDSWKTTSKYRSSTSWSSTSDWLSSETNVVEKVGTESTTRGKEVEYLGVYWDPTEFDSRFNVDFDKILYSDFEDVYEDTLLQFKQSQINGIAADLSDLRSKQKWILDLLWKDDEDEKTVIWMENILIKNLTALKRRASN